MSEPVRIRAWQAEFADPSMERAYREWACPANARYIQRVTWVAAALYLLFILTDLARIGPGGVFWALLTLRVATAIAAVLMARSLASVTDADAADRVALLIEGIFLAGSAVVFGILYTIPSELRDPMFLSVAQFVVLVAVYFLFQNGLALQVAVGLSAAGIWATTPWALGVIGSAGWVSQVLYNVLANVLGLMVANRVHHSQRGQYASLVREHELNERLRGEVERRKVSENDKNRLFSIVAHDLRNPLNAVLGFTEILASEDFPPEEFRKHARATHRAARRLQDLVDNLLYWSRIQMNRIQVAPGEEDLRRLVDEGIAQTELTAAEKGVRLRNASDSLSVRVDPGLFAVVLRNLVTNAAKFSHPGSEVVVWGRAVDDAVEVAVADSGIGMTKDQVKGLFHDGESTVGTQGESGSGLGLRLCKDLIERQGGTIRIESVVGEGTTVRFTVPRAESAETFSDHETSGGSGDGATDTEAQGRRRTA